ncbi:MAG: RNA-binding cell elongation regulator Jag/EloR [Anaerolineae bacterium]
MSSEESTAVVVVTAASVDEAIILGLTRLMATRDEVDIEVLDEGSHGFLGIGAREASVRIARRDQTATPAVQQPEEPEPSIPEPEPAPEVLKSEPPTPEPKPAPVSPAPKPEPETTDQTMPPEEAVTTKEPVAPAKPAPSPKPTPVEKKEKKGKSQRSSSTLDRDLVEKTALEVAENLFVGLNIQYSLSWEQEDRPALWISLHGKDADVMVGPRAQTLNSIQYLFRTLLHRMIEGNFNVVIDADGYRKRRRRSLQSLARKMADKAVKSGRTVRMKPMPAHERRIIHILLRKDKRVKTESTGRGRTRAVTIVPNKKEP